MFATHSAKSVLRPFSVSETCAKCFRGGDDCITPIRAGDLVLSELVRLDSGATLRRFSHLETCVGKAVHHTLPNGKTALATLHPLDHEWYCDRIMRDRTAIEASAFFESDKDARQRKLAAVDFEAIRRAQAEYDARVVSEDGAVRDKKEATEATGKQRQAIVGVDERALWSKALELHQQVTGPKLSKSHPVFGWDVVGPEVLKLRAKQQEEAEKAAAIKAAAEAKVLAEGAAALVGSSAAAGGSAAEATGNVSDADAAGVGKGEQENEEHEKGEEGTGPHDPKKKGKAKAKSRAVAPESAEASTSAVSGRPPVDDESVEPLFEGSDTGRVTRQSKKRAPTPKSATEALETAAKGTADHKRGKASGAARSSGSGKVMGGPRKSGRR
ncbi:hypothetical protein BCR44DRAFT_38316 [Catenaria anguillulae PL171]|uniref:Uncharacterized protein n=1 Tax=Catenaria anguillulae PL171 TaxID=765915 RepID=A0A1Y2HT80_9FUNG|nr:hypothetical protein BCR44DRAFT_38316 [Catenaria anguillulae PL171]